MILWVYYIVSGILLIASKSINQSFYYFSLFIWIFLMAFKLLDILLVRINLKNQQNFTQITNILVDIFESLFYIQRVISKSVIFLASFIAFTLFQEANLWIQLSKTTKLLSDLSAKVPQDLTNISLSQQQYLLQTCSNDEIHIFPLSSSSSSFFLPFYHNLYLSQLLLGFLLKSFYEYQYFCTFQRTFTNLDYKQILYFLVNITSLQGLYYIIYDHHPDLLYLLILFKLLLLTLSTIVIIHWKLSFFGMTPNPNIHSPFQIINIILISGVFILLNIPIPLEQFLSIKDHPDRWQIQQSTQISKSIIILCQTFEIILILAFSVIDSYSKSILIQNLLVICQFSAIFSIFFAANHFIQKYKEIFQKNYKFCYQSILPINELIEILRNSSNLQYLEVKNNILIRDSDILIFNNQENGFQHQKELLLFLLKHISNSSLFLRIPQLITTIEASPQFLQITNNQLSLAQGFCQLLSDLSIPLPYLLSFHRNLTNEVLKLHFTRGLSNRIFNKGFDQEMDRFIKRQNEHIQAIGMDLKRFHIKNCLQVIAFDRFLMPPLTNNPREIMFDLVYLDDKKQ